MSQSARWRRLPAPSTRLLAIPVALACFAGALYLAFAESDAARVDRADRAGLQGRLADAAALAHGVSRAPADARASLIEAYALRGMARFAEADAAFARAARHQPDDWTVRRDWALVLLRLGRRADAARQMARALELNPRMPLPPGFRRSEPPR